MTERRSLWLEGKTCTCGCITWVTKGKADVSQKKPRLTHDYRERVSLDSNLMAFLILIGDLVLLVLHVHPVFEMKQKGFPCLWFLSAGRQCFHLMFSCEILPLSFGLAFLCWLSSLFRVQTKKVVSLLDSFKCPDQRHEEKQESCECLWIQERERRKLCRQHNVIFSSFVSFRYFPLMKRESAV